MLFVVCCSLFAVCFSCLLIDACILLCVVFCVLSIARFCCLLFAGWCVLLLFLLVCCLFADCCLLGVLRWLFAGCWLPFDVWCLLFVACMVLLVGCRSLLVFGWLLLVV